MKQYKGIAIFTVLCVLLAFWIFPSKRQQAEISTDMGDTELALHVLQNNILNGDSSKRAWLSLARAFDRDGQVYNSSITWLKVYDLDTMDKSFLDSAIFRLAWLGKQNFVDSLIVRYSHFPKGMDSVVFGEFLLQKGSYDILKRLVYSRDSKWKKDLYEAMCWSASDQNCIVQILREKSNSGDLIAKNEYLNLNKLEVPNGSLNVVRYELSQLDSANYYEYIGNLSKSYEVWKGLIGISSHRNGFLSFLKRNHYEKEYQKILTDWVKSEDFSGYWSTYLLSQIESGYRLERIEKNVLTANLNYNLKKFGLTKNNFRWILALNGRKYAEDVYANHHPKRTDGTWTWDILSDFYTPNEQRQLLSHFADFGKNEWIQAYWSWMQNNGFGKDEAIKVIEYHVNCLCLENTNSLIDVLDVNDNRLIWEKAYLQNILTSTQKKQIFKFCLYICLGKFSVGYGFKIFISNQSRLEIAISNGERCLVGR